MSDVAMGAEDPKILLMNAPGNKHTLAIRILTLWLWNRGSRARMIDPPPTLDELNALVIRAQPRLILVSMALAEQRVGVTATGRAHCRVASLDPSQGHRGGICREAWPRIAYTGRRTLGDISLL